MGVFPGYARSLLHFGLVLYRKGEIEPCDQSVVEYGIALEGLPEDCFRFDRPAKELMSCGKGADPQSRAYPHQAGIEYERLP